VDNLVSSSPQIDQPTATTTVVNGAAAKAADGLAQIDTDLAQRLDKFALEAIVELKISRFLDQIGSYYPEDLHSLIMKKVEKPLLGQILRRTGGNQVHASKILGINRNTLRKKMKLYGFSS
jgi:DNA-binding protein Fis